MRSRKTLLLTLGLVAMAGLLACSNPATDKPEAVVEEATQAAPAASGGERYTLADGSAISFVGSKVTGSHDGGFHEFEGEILVVDGDPTRSSVKLNIATSSLWADNENLTKHLKSEDFFEVATYPTATFESTAIAREGDGYMVTGNLDLHGVTKSITFPATISVEPGSVTAQAEFFIQRFDFGIVYKGKADNLIRDEVVIKFDLKAQPAA